MFSPIRVNVQSESQLNSGADSIKLVKNFLKSIECKASNADVFIAVSTNNGSSQLIKFSHFDNPFFPANLFGTDFNEYSVNIKVVEIQSIEIMPKIGELVKSSDKDKLAALGITFDERGFINIPHEKFICEKNVGSNNYHIKISSKDGEDVASINTKMTSHQSYCRIRWS